MEKHQPTGSPPTTGGLDFTTTSDTHTEGVFRSATSSLSNLRRVGQQVGFCWNIAKPYWNECVSARFQIGLLLLLTVLNSGLLVAYSYVSKDFWNAIPKRDVAEFRRELVRLLAVIVATAPLQAIKEYQTAQLKVHWREWLSKRMVRLYMANQVYYKLSLQSTSADASATTTAAATDAEDSNWEGSNTRSPPPVASIDNPDQRLAEDANDFTDESIGIIILLFSHLLNLGSFSYILFSIYPQLILFCLLYASFGTVITTWIGHALVTLAYAQQRFEASFRYRLVRLRDHAEAVACYDPTGNTESVHLFQPLSAACANQRDINAAQRNVDCFSGFFFYLASLIPVVVVAPEYFRNEEMEFGMIMQASAAFGAVLSNLSLVVTSFERLSEYAATGERLREFLESMQHVDRQRSSSAPLLQPPSGESGIVAHKGLYEACDIVEETNDGNFCDNDCCSSSFQDSIDLCTWTSRSNGDVVLDMQDVTIHIAVEPTVYSVKNLNLQVSRGQHLLVTGPSGVGKSTLVRAIAGLTSTGSGIIGRPAAPSATIVSQRPYCTLGTLRDQLVYPLMGSLAVVPNEELLQVLVDVGLSHVAERIGDGDALHGLCDVELDWTKRLSLGEQQRLAFGRLLVHPPALAVLDESTSALDCAMEERLYRQLANNKTTTYISVSHRPELATFHTRELRLLGEGGYEITPAATT